MRKVDLVVVALAAPLLVGVYENNHLIQQYESHEKSTDYLPELFSKLLKSYEIESITYANGPGSFMAIKISYLFFRTLEIAKGIKLYAASAFEFNQKTPIKAMGKLYFHLKEGAIVIEALKDEEPKPFSVPEYLNEINKEKQTEPNYILPAVS